MEGLAAGAPGALPDIARASEEGCTITATIRDAVAISVDVRSV